MLRALYDLYDRLTNENEYEIAPRGKSYQKVTFIVVITDNGRLVDIQDARLPSPDGRSRPRPRRTLVLGDTKPSGSGLNPCFLWDNTGYLLGWDPENTERAKRSFEAFRERHLQLEQEISVDDFSAVCRFLERWNPAQAANFPVLEEIQSGFGVFQIQGTSRFVHENPKIESWWKRRFDQQETGPPGQCLVTGMMSPIARTHPKIKGVAGSQKSGATIAGFNDPAYWSYGFEQSYNSPISEDAAHRYTTALNALLDGPKRDKHHLIVGGTTVVFWTERPTATEDIFAAFAADGSSVLDSAAIQDGSLRLKLQAFLKALRAGQEAYTELENEPGRTGYFLLGLATPTPARVAVRFFHQGTLAELLENLRRHHQDISVERQFGEGTHHPEPEFPSAKFLLRELLETAYKNKNKEEEEEKDILSALSGKLLESIVTGTRYPESLYSAVMRRIVADRIINYARACVIKGYLVRNRNKEVAVSLDTLRIEPAYRLGRLFAVLDKTQQDALGKNIDTTVRDRFYAAASSTPAAVFPRLLRTYQHHLVKLKGGRKVNREKLVQDILEPLSEIPAHLNISDQGLFALGYYHQMNAFYANKEKSAESTVE